MGTTRAYTTEQVDWLRENYPLMPLDALHTAFNAQFGQARTRDAIKATLGREKITSGRTGRFEQGQHPWNRGSKGIMRANVCSFKKGNVPPNRKPLYSERICTKDGYINISVPERNPYTGYKTRYKHKQIWVWEQVNGKVPKDHCVIFLDGNKLNCELNNLALVHRSELLSLSLHKYTEAPPELKPSIFALAKLEANAGIRTYSSHRRSREKRA